MLLQHRRDRRATRPAFTLLEVLIVVAIIVMLSGAGSYFFFQQYEDAKLGTAKRNANTLSGLVDSYRVAHNDTYPNSLEDLTQQIDGKGPYCSRDQILDPWGKPYQFNAAGPKNSGMRADISTTSPKGVLIGNFSN